MRQFHELLTEAIYRIGRYEGKTIKYVHEELGTAIGKTGYSIEHWRKAGNKPSKLSDLEGLAQELVRRKGILSQAELEEFLTSGEHPDALPISGQLLGDLERELDSISNLSATPHPEGLLWRLPMPTYDQLFGVESDVDLLLRYLQNQHQYHIISIYGLGGIGKTALTDYAVRTLLQGSHQFQDVVWVSAKQEYLTEIGIAHHEIQVSLQSLFDEIGRQLEETDILHLSLAQKVSRLALKLRAEPHLIIIDNLETVQDFQRLLPWLEQLADPTKFLLTSRHMIPSLTTVAHLRLTELETEASLALTQHIAQIKGISDVNHSRIYELVGGNPLALILIVSQMQYLPAEEVLKGIKLGTLEDIYSYIFYKAWSILSDRAKEVLFVIQRAGDDADWDWLVTMLDLSAEDLQAAMRQLISLSLVQPQRGPNDERYFAIHRLTSTFLRVEVLGWK